MMNRLDDFDEQEEMGEQAQTHIWLRYATQFTSGERSYTIDIGIPVPLGADAETREQLLREADAGLDQLADYVERRVMQVVQQSGGQPSAPSRPASPPIPAPTPVAAPTPISLPASTPAVQPSVTSNTGSQGRSQAPAAPASPAREGTSSSPSPSTPASQPAPKKQPAPPATPAPVPPSRPNIAASMPPSPGLPAGTLPLPEFLKYLKEMGLDARRAMALLKVKSLSGLNLREALEQLQHILVEEGGTSPAQSTAQPATRTPTGPQAPMPSQSTSSRPAPGAMESHSISNPANPTGSRQEKAGASKPMASATQTSQTPPSTAATRSTPAAGSTSASSRPGSSATPTAASPKPMDRPSTNPGATARPAVTPTAAANGTKQTANVPQPLVIHEGKPPYPVPVVFDEEEDEMDLEDLFDEDEDEENQDSAFGTGVGLSAANRGSAEDIVSRLREAGGSSPVSPTRLKVLHNVVDGQLTPEQLQALIRGVWGTASEKKLKGEQAEALISWGKQDEFVTEAEMLLALFEEDGNASSNR